MEIVTLLNSFGNDANSFLTWGNDQVLDSRFNTMWAIVVMNCCRIDNLFLLLTYLRHTEKPWRQIVIKLSADRYLKRGVWLRKSVGTVCIKYLNLMVEFFSVLIRIGHILYSSMFVFVLFLLLGLRYISSFLFQVHFRQGNFPDFQFVCLYVEKLEWK